MALATRCPHCNTVFKVANDQLKLRGGLVRCGVCQRVFNGMDGLVPMDGTQHPGTDRPSGPPPPAAAPQGTQSGAPPENVTADRMATDAPPAGVPGKSHSPSLQAGPEAAAADAGTSDGPHQSSASSAADAAASDADHDAPSDSSLPARPDPVIGALLRKDGSTASSSGKSSSTRGAPIGDPLPAGRVPDPMLRMTLLDIAQPGNLLARPSEEAVVPDGAKEPAAATADPLAEAIDELNARPLTGSLPATEQDEEDRAIDPDLAEPSFLRSTARQQRLNRFFATGVTVLAVLLAIQLAYFMRHRIVSAIPQAEALYHAACVVFRCEMTLPADIESVLIESSELQQAAGGASGLTLSFSLQNKSGTAQAWPHLELTLNDASDQPLVRRIFRPDEYVDSADRLRNGLAQENTASFRIGFTLDQVKASGYRLYVFYP